MDEFKDYTVALRYLTEIGTEKAISLLDMELSLPNIPTPTMGGKVFWTTLTEYNGWKLQQNQITKHARILDDRDVRIAWGTVNGMIKALDRMVERANAYAVDPAVASRNRESAMADLKALKELLDIGAISEEEYARKKEKLLEMI